MNIEFFEKSVYDIYEYNKRRYYFNDRKKRNLG